MNSKNNINWREEYNKKKISIKDFANKVKSGDTISTGQSITGVSPEFHDALIEKAEAGELENVKWCDTVQVRWSKFYDVETMKKLDGKINLKSYYSFNIVRPLAASKHLDFQIAQGADIGDKINHISDIYTVMVSPPDEHGFVSYGLGNFYTHDVIAKGREVGKIRLIIAEINDQMPVVYGKNNFAHISQFDYVVENSTPMLAVERNSAVTAKEWEKKIGENVLELIKNGDCIQMGAGGISETVVNGLDGFHDLGIHSEMVPASLPELVEKGIVTNSRKPFNTGITAGTFIVGSQKLYDFVTKNRSVELHPASYINNIGIIAQIPNIKALNTAIMIDLTGQVVCEGIGHRHISGVGGQLDFMAGAYWAPGGRGITLLQSAKELANGNLVSSIVSELPAGTPVGVPRTYVDTVVTEYGVARLRYLSRRERADALISIAHPDFRADLKKAAQSSFYPSRNNLI